MCDDRRDSTRDQVLPRPRWTALYGIVVSGSVSAVAVEVLSPVGAARTALRLAVVVGSSVAIALWVRLNRVSLDAQDWCVCAPEKMTVRVVRASPPYNAPTERHQSAHGHDDRVVEHHELTAH